MRGRMARSIVAVLLLALGAARAAAAQDLGLKVGAKAPGAAVQTLDGRSVDLGEYIGKTPMLIEFWATWCENCHELEPSLKAAVTKYGDKVKFVGVAVSVNQSPERVKKYVAEHGLTPEILYDRTGAATNNYQVPATSYVVVLDKAGKVVYTGLGGDQKLEDAVKKGVTG